MTRLLATLAVILLVGLTAACGNDKTTGDKGYIEGDGSILRFEAAERKPVEAITGKALDGSALSLRELGRGKPVVVNIWASWCPPCRKESATLVKAHDELGDTAAFMGIDVRDASTAQGQAFERNFEVPWPSLYDPSGRSLLAFPAKFKISPSAIPSTVVLDPQGRVAALILGPVTSKETLVGLVQDAAA